MAALADELGFDRFGVTGGSGGGPHVLACAALLPDRVVRAVCAVGVAPFGRQGLEQDEWLAGMDEENIKEVRWALLRARRCSTPSSSSSTSRWRSASPSIRPPSWTGSS